MMVVRVRDDEHVKLMYLDISLNQLFSFTFTQTVACLFKQYGTILYSSYSHTVPHQ